MQGNRVRMILLDGNSVTGILHKLDVAGAVVYRDQGIPEAHGTVFLPMHRIQELVDLGRAP
jgi:hypothetical protein